MRYLFYSLPLGIFLSVGVGLTSAADSVLRGYAVAEETIVPGEAPDLARVSAFMRARLELIESIAKAAQDQTLTLAGVREDLEAAIADHLAVRILREVQQEDAHSLHVVVEVEGAVEPRALLTASLNAPLFRQAKDNLRRLRSQVVTLRGDLGQSRDDDARVETLLQLERLDIEAIRLACFTAYPLAGSGFCAEYRRQAEDDYRLVSVIMHCGGERAWRLFSPFHRIAAFLSEHLQALEEHRETAHDVLGKHLRHKEAVFKAYPYLRNSKEAPLFEPVTWTDAQGTRREIPINEWTSDMVMTVLQRELTLWQGITIGWQIMRDGFADGECARHQRGPLEPSIAQQTNP